MLIHWLKVLFPGNHGQRLGCADGSEGLFRHDMFNHEPEGGNLNTGTLKTHLETVFGSLPDRLTNVACAQETILN